MKNIFTLLFLFLAVSLHAENLILDRLLIPSPISVPIPQQGFTEDIPFDATGQIVKSKDHLVVFAGGRVLVFNNENTLTASILEPANQTGKSYHGFVLRISIGDDIAILAHRKMGYVVQLFLMRPNGQVLANLNTSASDYMGGVIDTSTLIQGSTLNFYFRTGENEKITHVEIKHLLNGEFQLLEKQSFSMTNSYFPPGATHGGNGLTLTTIKEPCHNRTRKVLLAEYFLDANSFEILGDLVKSNGDPELPYIFDPNFKSSTQHADSILTKGSEAFVLLDNSRIAKANLETCGTTPLKFDFTLTGATQTQGQQLALTKNHLASGKNLFDHELNLLQTGTSQKISKVLNDKFSDHLSSYNTSTLAGVFSPVFYQQSGGNPYSPKFTPYAINGDCPITKNGQPNPWGLPTWCSWYAPRFGGAPRYVGPVIKYLENNQTIQSTDQIAIVHTPKQLSIRNYSAPTPFAAPVVFSHLIKQHDLDHIQQVKNFRAFDSRIREDARDIISEILPNYINAPSFYRLGSLPSECNNIRPIIKLEQVSSSSIKVNILNKNSKPTYLFVGLGLKEDQTFMGVPLNVDISNPALYFIHQMQNDEAIFQISTSLASQNIYAQGIFECSTFVPSSTSVVILPAGSLPGVP